ncbi:MAG: glutathione S-transferase family protein [Halieaceae bacterium]
MILHHYPMSPFSEKIRLMLGYTGINWQSTIAPEMPPRPGVDPLAGGYRRIPVAQQGADIFCDTRLISAEIATLAAMPALDPGHCDEAALGFDAALEGDVFWACVASIPARKILSQLFRKLGVRKAVRFIFDRAGMARAAKTRPMSPQQAAAVFERHLEQLEAQLSGSALFLFGDSPSHTDFAAYHTLWFQHVVGELPLPAHLPQLLAWYERISAFGHARSDELSVEQAFAAARHAEPREIPAAMTVDALIGEQVSVQPDDYALDSTGGTLVGVSDSRIIIARDSEVAGRVHVHFPAQGFTLVPS